MLWNKKAQYRAEDSTIRPALRILGAPLLGFVAYRFADAAEESFHLASAPQALCQGKLTFWFGRQGGC